MANTLKINYYSNYAQSAIFRDEYGEIQAEYTLDPTQNMLVRSDIYDGEWRIPEGLRDYTGYSELNTLPMTRDGYKGTGFWNTQPDGTGIGFPERPEDAGYLDGITGNELAEHFQVSFDSSGYAELNLYPQWEVYAFKINFYSGYADKVRDTSSTNNPVIQYLDSSQNILIRSDYYGYNDFNSLRDYEGDVDGDTLVMRRIGFLPLGYWNTEPDYSGQRISTDYYGSGESILNELGLTLNLNTVIEINLYPEWERQTQIYICNDGTIWASDFLIDSEISIDENAFLRANDFIYAEEISFDENGNIYGQFKGGSPDYPIAAII